jgi:hypothetical protein
VVRRRGNGRYEFSAEVKIEDPLVLPRQEFAHDLAGVYAVTHHDVVNLWLARSHSFGRIGNFSKFPSFPPFY